MARSPLADSLSKVRKRYQRYASRLENEAKASSGTTSELLQSQARRLRKDAQGLTLKNLRNKHANDDIESIVKEIESDSVFALTKTSQATREAKLGKIFLSHKDIARRFYAGTIDIWRGKKGAARDKAIIEYFGVDNIYQAMMKVSEAANADILVDSDGEEDPYYSATIDAIREEVASRLALG